jgi:hypothetical protein
MILLALAAAAAALAPRPGHLETYKDWIVGCDNVRTCQANVLDPVDGDGDFMGLVLTRDGAPKAPTVLHIFLPGEASAGSRYSLRVDGKTIAAFAAGKGLGYDLALTRPILAALANGTKLDLFDAKGANVGASSLAGLAAALLYIDERQARVGTAGALKAVGGKPYTAVSAPPLAPLVTVPPASPKPPRRITVAQATRLIGEDAAVCEYATHKVEPISHRLDAGHTLVLVDFPCGNGAYNYFTGVYVLDEKGPPRAAQFDVPPGMGEPSTDSTGELTNGDWDPKTRTLGSYEKGRGLGDCGSTETYAWDGHRFRLTEQALMGECRGSTDYIRVWTARTSP